MGLINNHGELFSKAPGNATRKSPCTRSLCPLGYLCHRNGLIMLWRRGTAGLHVEDEGKLYLLIKLKVRNSIPCMESCQFDLLRPRLRLAPTSQLSLRQMCTFMIHQVEEPQTWIDACAFEDAEYRERVETDECEEHDFEKESGLRLTDVKGCRDSDPLQ
eukprot:6217338-Amphidinium_carterae.1